MDDSAGATRLRVAGAVLFCLSAAVVGFSLAGTWALANLDAPDADYERLSQTLAIVNICLASGACLAWLWAAQGPRMTASLLLLSTVISGGVEALGVATGFPFGDYRYTEQLGPRLGGLVPAVIPLAWFMMVYPALHVAQWTRFGLRGKAALVGLAMVTWDLALDPAMTADIGAWEWHQGGVYYGVPTQNYLGWFLTASIVAWACLRVPGTWQVDRSRMPVAMFLLQSLFPALLAILYGRGWAALVWLIGLGLLWAVVRRGALPGGVAPGETGIA